MTLVSDDLANDADEEAVRLALMALVDPFLAFDLGFERRTDLHQEHPLLFPSVSGHLWHFAMSFQWSFHCEVCVPPSTTTQ